MAYEPKAKLAKLAIGKWEKNLSPTEFQHWTNLVEDTNKNQKIVDSLVEELKIKLQAEPGGYPWIHKGLIKLLRRQLSGQFDTLTACITKEVNFLPESLCCLASRG